jgi:hypothetical protein
MPRKKKAVVQPTPAGWTITLDVTINGRHVTPGTELKITGERGRFMFVRHVETDKGASWIDVVGGPTGYVRSRSFRVDRVKTVHRKKRIRPHAA